jgi:hypothetical protein
MEEDEIILDPKRVEKPISTICIQVETDVLIERRFQDLRNRLLTLSNIITIDVVDYIYNVCLQYRNTMPENKSVARVNNTNVLFQFIRIENNINGCANFWNFHIL